MIPLKILNRLRLGRTVSAEIEPSLLNHRAWIHVSPIIDQKKGYLEYSTNSEPMLIAFNPLDDPIIGFEIWYREIDRKFEEKPEDWDIVGLSIDKKYRAVSETELEKLLSQWLKDMSQLDLPHFDRSPF